MAPEFHSKLKRALWSLVVIICGIALLGGFCWGMLRKGISCKELSLASLDLTELSLRLDRGFIIHVGGVRIADSVSPADTAGEVF